MGERERLERAAEIRLAPVSQSRCWLHRCAYENSLGTTGKVYKFFCMYIILKESLKTRAIASTAEMRTFKVTPEGRVPF